jgi:hypothetical protein
MANDKYPLSELTARIIGKDYHCGGCISGPTVWDKYWNFILSRERKEGHSAWDACAAPLKFLHWKGEISISFSYILHMRL